MSRKYKFHDNDKPDRSGLQQHNKPLEIKDQEMFDKTLEYIHLNLPTGRQVR